MESVINIEALAAPLSEEDPCGVDTRNDTSFDSPYHKLKDARESAMAVERPDRSAQPSESQKGSIADVAKWKVVVDSAIDILKSKSKDLEVCALLVEGLARTAGPAGIRDGFRLTNRLIDDYWENLFPRIDPDEEDSIEDRIAAFTGLNGVGQQGTLATYISKLPVTNNGGMDNFRVYDYERAWTVNNNPDPDKRDEQASALGFTLEEIEKAAAQTPGEFYIEMRQTLRECLEDLRALDQAFVNACGHNAPPSGMIADALEKLSDVISHLGRDKLQQHAGSAEAAGEDVPGESPGLKLKAQIAASGNKAVAVGAIRSRADAITRLRAVAEYFRETEPHSPVSYSLNNLIRWSQLPLDKLIEEWIQDPEARSRYLLMTGMRLKEGQSEED